MSDLEKGRQLWEAAWGRHAGWMKLPDTDAYYASGKAESAFNLWCHENLPALLDTLATVRAWAEEYITSQEEYDELLAILDRSNTDEDAPTIRPKRVIPGTWRADRSNRDE